MIIRDIEEKRERANIRRERNDWELNSKCPIQGLEAHAVLNYLIEYEGIDPDSMDVYDIYPYSEFYKMTHFEIISDNDYYGYEYISGDEDDTDGTAEDYLIELYNDIGVDHFSKNLLYSNLDESRVDELISEVVYESVYDSPESYLNDEDRELSYEQQESIKILQLKIDKYGEYIESIKSLSSEEMIKKYEGKIKDMNKYIDEIREDIESILHSPEGDFPDSIIDERAESVIEDYTSNYEYFFDEYGFDIKEYIDMKSLVRDVIDIDGYDNLFPTYDGKLYEVYVGKKRYFVGRID